MRPVSTFLQTKSILLVLAFIIVSGCGATLEPPNTYFFARAGAKQASPAFQQAGNASWYGRQFHGRTTASGEIYDMYQLTAAHRQLPFGTMVRVVNRTNNRGVIVRINDRGPFASQRVIDLSFEAAKAIGIIQDGVAPVLVEVIKLPDEK